MKKITNYPGYFCDGVNVYKEKQNGEFKIISKTQSKTSKTINVKMKHLSKGFKSVTWNKVISLSGHGLKLPIDAVKIIGSKDYIDKKGNIYNFGLNNPQGIIKKPSVGSSGYPAVGIRIDGKTITRNIHSLLLNAFVYPGYEEDGLCCMHKDNNKLNYSLDNLEVGTYSQNNKDAYDDGLNKGNKVWTKKRHIDKFMQQGDNSIKVNLL